MERYDPSEFLSHSIRVTEQRPTITPPGAAGVVADDRPVSQASFRSQPVIVHFYSAAMTPSCTTQACDFQDSLPSFQTAG